MSMPQSGRLVTREVRWRVADAMYDALELADASAHFVRSIWTHGGPDEWEWSARLGRAIPPKATWFFEPSPVAPQELARAIFDGDSIAPARKATTTIIVFDFDPLKGESVASIEDAMAKTSAQKRRRAARWVGARVRRLLERFPDLPWFVEYSGGRGAHAVLRLARAIPVATAHAIGRAMLAAAGIDVRAAVEVFPRPEGESSRWCALPCTGRARAVEADLVTLRTRTRAEDAIAFLATEAVDPSELPGAAAAPANDVAPAPLPKGPPVTKPGFRHPAEREERPLADDGGPLPQTRNAKGDRRWDAQMLAVLSGVPNDGSWRAVSKFVACCFYLAISRADADRAFDSWLLLDSHEADHFRSEAGRKALRRVYRACWKRCARGVDDGWLAPGLMRSRAVRDRFRELAEGADFRRAA